MSEEASQTTDTSNESSAEATVVNDDGSTVSETSYLDGKYKSVSDLENGYKELQSSYSKKLGGFEGSPEAYELAEGVESNGRIEALQEWGKENQLSNQALNDIIAMDSAKVQAESEVHVAEQRELLGKEADARINNVVDWAKANIGEDALGALDDMITTADGVKLFEQVMKLSQGTAPATAPSAKVVDADTINDMQMATDKFGERMMNQPAYAAKVRAMRQQLQG